MVGRILVPGDVHPRAHFYKVTQVSSEPKAHQPLANLKTRLEFLEPESGFLVWEKPSAYKYILRTE